MKDFVAENKERHDSVRYYAFFVAIIFPAPRAPYTPATRNPLCRKAWLQGMSAQRRNRARLLALWGEPAQRARPPAVRAAADTSEPIVVTLGGVGGGW